MNLNNNINSLNKRDLRCHAENMLLTHVHRKAQRRRRKDESEKTKRRKRKDEGGKTKRRKRKDEKTKAKSRKDEKTKAKRRKDESEKTLNSELHVFVISPSLFRYVAFVISLCRLRYFVFSSFRFRLFAFVFSSFRYGAFVMSPRNNEKTKWHKSATIIFGINTLLVN